MSAPAFTPGPWQADRPQSSSRRVFMPDDTVEIRDAGLQLVACLYRENLHAEQDEANARLIAAAPELYRQLEIFVSTIVNDDLLAMDPDLSREVEATTALLVKARGEQVPA